MSKAQSTEFKQEIDIAVDAPPDLSIEVDITSGSLNRFPIFAAVGIPEVWRFDGKKVAILRLEPSVYVEAANSLVFPAVTKEILTHFLDESQKLKCTACCARSANGPGRKVELLDRLIQERTLAPHESH